MTSIFSWNCCERVTEVFRCQIFCFIHQVQNVMQEVHHLHLQLLPHLQTPHPVIVPIWWPLTSARFCDAYYQAGQREARTGECLQMKAINKLRGTIPRSVFRSFHFRVLQKICQLSVGNHSLSVMLLVWERRGGIVVSACWLRNK